MNLPAMCETHYLVDYSRDQRVPAHGCVVVEVAGARLATLILPQDAGDVDH